MIEVLKFGNPKFKCTCDSCASVLSFQKDDAEKWVDPPSGWSGYTVRCPVCGNRIEVGNDKQFSNYIKSLK